MPCYIISYDLRNERDYSALYEAIKGYGTWAHITESTWAVVADERAAEVRDDLLQHMDDDDALFVVKSGVAAAWRNVLCKDTWLRHNL